LPFDEGVTKLVCCPEKEGEKASILQYSFTDIDQVAEAVKGISSMECTQLSAGPFQSTLAILTLNEVLFLFAETSCPIHSYGYKNTSFFACMCHLEIDVPPVISHGRRVSHNTLWGFHPKWEGNFILPAQVPLVTVFIPWDMLHHYLQIMQRTDLDERAWASNYLTMPTTLPPVRAYLRQLYNLVMHQPDRLSEPHLKQLILEDFIPLLINAIPPVDQTILKPSRPFLRSELIQQAKDYLIAHQEQPLTLKDLCNALHTSRHPLFNGFKEVFGVGPMEYLKILRLHSVRRFLKVADPKSDSVRVIARKYGFWSAGHFSRDYKTMFGELPSETLKRA
jgi:AraC family ethanolamine operon transcriptional activator